MKVSPARLADSSFPAVYLYGEDGDAVFEAAELLLAGGDPAATRLRVDISELARIEVESRSQGLFGSSGCNAVVRNAGSANPKQTEHLLKLARQARPENRLIICAAEIDWKKALHKKLQAIDSLAQCEFHLPTPADFRRWLEQEIGKAGLKVSEEALELMSERLHGLRAAARQLIDRLRLFDGGRGEPITLAEVGDLLGERSPEDIEAYCHAVAGKSAAALPLLHRLFSDQQVAGAQIISWLGTRMNQLLMYRWYQAQKERNPAQRARLFGSARQMVPQKTHFWRGDEIAAAIRLISETEKLIKGASVEDDLTLLERMTMQLIRGDIPA